MAQPSSTASRRQRSSACADAPSSEPFERLLRAPGRAERVTHVERLPARPGRQVDWPDWAHPALIRRWAELGVTRPWSHQRVAAEHARAGRHVVLSTGTASGKSVAYLLPALTALITGLPRNAAAATAAANAARAAATADGPSSESPASEGSAPTRPAPGNPGRAGGAPPAKASRPHDSEAPAAQMSSRPSVTHPVADLPASSDHHQTDYTDYTDHTGHTHPGRASFDRAPSARASSNRASSDRTERGPASRTRARKARGARAPISGTAPDGTSYYQLEFPFDLEKLRARTDDDTLGTGAFSDHAPATALYIAPTKALAADQLRVVADLAGAPGVGVDVATYDGDTPREERDRARRNASYVLTNPDMLHRAMLPDHARWARFFGALAYVIVDECHHYRGVFGSHVAQVLRRLRRVAAHYGANPVFILASATVSEPAESAARLTGVPVVAVEEDGSPCGQLTFALWEPPLTSARGEQGAPVRRTTTAEAADLMTDLVVDGVRTVTFIRSRRGAETIAMRARDQLAEVAPELAERVASYRGGYLPEERRELERALHRGELMGVAATNALELGVDISGLDAVVLAGYPGTRNSMWQQAGRAGRAGNEALAILVARDDPLDTFLVHHPASLFGASVEATVFDPDNPYVVRPHLAAAAAELVLRPEELPLFGVNAESAVQWLERAGYVRRRKQGWFWTRRDRASDLADIRSAGGAPVRVVEDGTGRLLGTVDAGAAHSTVHEGAVYVHRGETYLVDRLDLDDDVAFVVPAQLDYTTAAREVTDIHIIGTDEALDWGDATLSFGSVEVTNQVVSFLRRRLVSGEVLGEVPLDLPSRTLRTRAVWWTLSAELVASAGVSPGDLPGAAHAAEHASIGLLPLFATCDRWDIGGVSTDRHADTGRVTVFVYDGHPGGAGFAERAFATARAWLTATREAIATCECRDGCPSCVQSPKCGNGNNPLHKSGAIRLLDALLAAAPAA